MNRLLTLIIAFLTVAGAAARVNPTARTATPPMTYGIAFYNLENLFDTINTNGNYDREFTPTGPRKWDTAKYRSKLSRLASAIAAMTTARTPDGPAVIGIAEVENRAVLEDLVVTPEIAGRNLGIIHHDSPDARGIDVALLYNPELFTPVDVTTHPLRIDSIPGLRTRDQLCVTGVLAPTIPSASSSITGPRVWAVSDRAHPDESPPPL